MAEVGKMAKINNFDEANDELLTVEEKLYCKKHSPIGGWNVVNLHYNWIVTRQLVGHQHRQESTIVCLVEEHGSLVKLPASI